MNLTRRREGRKDSIIALLFPIFTHSFLIFAPVIPAKAGIQRVAGGVGMRLSRPLAARRGLVARDTLILAFSHEGRRDPLAAIWT